MTDTPATTTDTAPIGASTGDSLKEFTYQDLLSMMDGGIVAHIQEVDEVRKVEKETLMGKPFILTSWHYQPDGDFGEFAVCEVTTIDDEKLLFIDGSTGIKDQLKLYEQKLGGVKPIYVPKGLRVSNYTYDDPFDGKSKPASTYYFSNES